jgi:formate dehydrogenase major subunit
VDPRFTRTSSIADVYARIRPGTDIAYLGAIISYVLREKLYDEPYLRLNTNAAFLVRDDFAFEDGLFSGYDAEKHKYENASWGYALDPATATPRKAEALDDPRTVLSKLREHYARYTFEAAEQITGIPAAQVKQIADLLVANRPGTILYALGMTQHTTGVQGIRCYAILQLLLGNIGQPGGGVNALRGEPNVQGACDMSVLYNYFSGYVAAPDSNLPTLKDYAAKYGTFRAKFVVNALKAWFGDAATPENDFGYGWLVKKTAGKPYSMFQMLEGALEGRTKLLYVMGQNPMVTNPNLNLTHSCLAGLEMLVVQDLWETETAAFWQRPGTDAKAIATEVILLPATYFMEKEGTISGSGRLVQWRYKAVEPPGEARADLEILDAVYKKVRALYAGSTQEKDRVLARAVWAYDGGPSKAEEVLKEINGRNFGTGELVGGIGELQADGSTSSGSWIYAGVFKGGKNLTKRRDNRTDPSKLGIYPGFAWSWPGNMHVLYNRASCDAAGKPLDPKRAIVWWDEAEKKWKGHDTPDVPVATDGPDTPNGQRPFRMAAEGVGRLLAAPYQHPDPALKGKEKLPRDSSTVLADGPLPEFYEPVESPVANLLHPAVQTNPALKYPRVPGRQPIGTSKEFPFVLCTASQTEHWCAGSVTRNVPWLNELAPEPWVEIPESLAERLKLRTGDRAKVRSARGEVEVKALVTKRMQTLRVQGQDVTVVWMPYNWGFKGLSQGPSTNVLTIDAGDANTACQETKACLVDVRKVEASVA